MLAVVRGGLGNQMFQVAHAFVVGRQFYCTPRFVDLSSTARVKRRWELSCFGIHPTELSPFEKIKFRSLMAMSRIVPKCFALSFLRVLREDNGRDLFSPNVRPNIISGYWQRPAIFEKHREDIQDLFIFPEHPFIKELRQEITGQAVVAIHIRRGDYVNDPAAKRIHYVCDENWYLRAWERMKAEIGPCKALVFSDDPDWVERNIRFEGDVSYVSKGIDRDAWVDMKAMSLCDHFIISNSTFSWWAAYLGEKKGGVVLAPSNWFRGCSTKDLGICPSHWKLI